MSAARSRVLKSAVDFIEFDRDYGFASNIEQLKDTLRMSRAQPKSSQTDQHARKSLPRLPRAGRLCARPIAIGKAEARGAAVLFLLDPDPVVRRAVAGALATAASSLSSIAVRRLIAIRN